MNRPLWRMTFLISLLVTGAFLAAAVKIWQVPGTLLGQLLVLSVVLLCVVIGCAWILVKLLGVLRVRGRVKKVANHESD